MPGPSTRGRNPDWNDSPRRSVRVPQPAFDKAQAYANLTGVSLSALGRSWLEAYVEGDDADTAIRQVAPAKVIQIVAPRELIERAEARAEAAGVDLRQVILHEIDQLDELA